MCLLHVLVKPVTRHKEWLEVTKRDVKESFIFSLPNTINRVITPQEKLEEGEYYRIFRG